MEEELKGKGRDGYRAFGPKNRDELREEKEKGERLRTDCSIAASDAARTPAAPEGEKDDMEKRERPMASSAIWTI